MNKVNLVLLPGLLNDARLWTPQVSGLSDLASASVADLTGADSIAALAASVLARAPAGKFALAGLSMGGYVALEIMRQAPQRISALALLDTTARADTPQATEARRGLLQTAQTDFAAVVAGLMPRLVHPEHLNDKAMIGTIEAMAMDLGAEVFSRQQRAIMGRIDSRPFLPRIGCPTLVLCGRQDVITPVEVHQELVDAIPGARLQIIEHCGHLATLGQAALVTEALRSWLPGST